MKDIESRIQKLAYNNYKYKSNLQPISLERSTRDFRISYGSTNVNFKTFLSTSRVDRLRILHLLLPSPRDIFEASVHDENTQTFLEYISNFTTDNNIQLNLARFLLKNSPNLSTQNNNFSFNRLFTMIEKYM